MNISSIRIFLPHIHPLEKSTPPPIPFPDTLKGVDDLIRISLEGFRDSCFNWLLVATFLVVIGLVCEGPELWHEITSIFGHWRFGRKFNFSLPEEHAPNRSKLLAFAGWALIVLGVAGEFVADSFVSKADGFVQKLDEVLLADAQRQTTLANVRSSAAYERAAQTEREAAQENVRAAEAERQASEENVSAAKALEAAEIARKQAEGFSLQIAQANERAARAEQTSDGLKEDAARLNKEAETEHLARVKLEQQLSWRSITPEQSQRIAKKLSWSSGQQFDMVTYASEGECLNFENEMYKTVLSARWVLDPKRKWSMLVALVIGVEVQMAENASEETKNAASALVDALTAEGFSSSLKTIPSSDGPNPAVINIAIGKNPVSMRPIELPP